MAAKLVQNIEGQIEKAIMEAKVARRELRYGYFLRRLSDDALNAITQALKGNQRAGGYLIYTAHRIAWLLRKSNPRRITDPTDRELQAASAQIVGDCLREWMRRCEVLTVFESVNDPYKESGPGRVELGEKAGVLTGDARLLLDKLIAQPETEPEPEEINNLGEENV